LALFESIINPLSILHMGYAGGRSSRTAVEIPLSSFLSVVGLLLEANASHENI